MTLETTLKGYAQDCGQVALFFAREGAADAAAYAATVAATSAQAYLAVKGDLDQRREPYELDEPELQVFARYAEELHAELDDLQS